VTACDGRYDFASPFGGIEQSGWGREMALRSLESFTRLESVWIHLASDPRSPPP
jgi:acyl-CoA reductase-like NAD-dependent aldehyde dehydrogenase